jgi:23S rRNA (cytosine1962-C5)-methyltransferase
MRGMFDASEYELLDFGQGRKLERFGQVVLDRPCPAAQDANRRRVEAWTEADGRFDRTDADQGVWNWSGSARSDWTVRHRDVCFQLRCTERGQVGLYAEQAENWDWIARQVRRGAEPLRVLNLFAYTGGSTLAAAAAGAQVVHVDAARNVVAWARRNAVLSGMAEAPIRWIAEDARKFVARERRRGNQYDAVILDPPSYGHGPKGEVWQLGRHLLPLLRDCGQLTTARRAFLLLTCHSPGYGPAELSACLADTIFGHCRADVFSRVLSLRTSDQRRLPSGVVSRWPR